MDKKQLMQYRSLLREIPKLNKDLEKLYERLENVPVVAGKVTKSGDDFPYIEQHVKVKMSEPKKTAEIQAQILHKEHRLDLAEKQQAEIEQFIAGIPDSTDRLMFEKTFIDGKKLEDVGRELGYTKGRISQKISGYLKD